MEDQFYLEDKEESRRLCQRTTVTAGNAKKDNYRFIYAILFLSA